jgi:Zn-dependent protease with chaperone function
MRIGILACALLFATGLSGCGTTFVLPELNDAQNTKAASMFADAQSESKRKPLSKKSAERRFNRVAKKVGPVGKQYCEALTQNQQNFNCNVDIAIDHKMQQRNAYFTYNKKGEPIIRMSMPLLQDTANDDEVAFVMGHEYGHLIGKHIEKQQTQAVVGALVLGAIAAAATAQSTAYGTYYDTDTVAAAVDIGAAAGSMAYSQTYELEGDTLGTRIAASAGYDPLEGAKFFARPEDAKTQSGKLSFWGTHPPNEKRFATVLATMEEIEADIELKRKQN